MSLRYWVGAGGNFGDAANWSDSSGGTGGYSVPDEYCLVYFNGAGGGCTVDASVGILGFSASADYTGTIAQNKSVAIYSDATFGGGVFQGDGTDVTVLGSLSLAGGTIHTKISVYGDVLCGAGFGSWTPLNDATVSMESTREQRIVTGGILPTLIVDKTGTSNQVKVFGSYGTLNINGDLMINSGFLDSKKHNIQVGSM